MYLNSDLNASQILVTRIENTSLMNLSTLTLLALTSLSLAGAAASQPQLSTQSIIVNPVTGDLSVHIRTNRQDGAVRVPSYAPGDHLEFYTRVNQNAYVYLFNVDAAGQVSLLADNGLQEKGNLVKANTSRVFPRKGVASTFLLTLPRGTNTVLALASKTPLNLRQLGEFQEAQGGALILNIPGQTRLAQALSIVVRPLPAQGWTSASAQYTVTRRSVSGLPEINLQGLKSQVTFESRAGLSEVFVTYADRLRGAGYQPVRAIYDKQSVSATLIRSDQMDRVGLKVKQVGRRFVVQVTHQ